jgi:U3 small nucleolar RNA-associated protein 5
MASVKRARALVGWLRETLIVHVGFLVTVSHSFHLRFFSS